MRELAVEDYLRSERHARYRVASKVPKRGDIPGVEIGSRNILPGRGGRQSIKYPLAISFNAVDAAVRKEAVEIVI